MLSLGLPTSRPNRSTHVFQGAEPDDLEEQELEAEIEISEQYYLRISKRLFAASEDVKNMIKVTFHIHEENRQQQLIDDTVEKDVLN